MRMKLWKNSLRILAKNCKYGSLESELIRDRLIVGLKDLKVAQSLEMDANLTLEKAVEKARQAEEVKKHEEM